MSEYKVGDKVRIVNNVMGYSEDFTGQECVVKDVTYTGVKLSVTYKDGQIKVLHFQNDIVIPVEKWIKWDGKGDMPVPEGTAINVEYRNGEITDAIAGRYYCSAEDWTHTNHPKDIVAYYVWKIGYIMPTEDNSKPEAYSYEELNSNFKKLNSNFKKLVEQGLLLAEEDSVTSNPANNSGATIGGAASSEHYINDAMQPIEIMQMTFSHEEMLGFLKGNIIKYSFRAGKKQGESAEKDLNKVKQYKMWLDIVLKGEVINPRTDVI